MQKDTEVTLNVSLKTTNFCDWKKLPYLHERTKLEKPIFNFEITTNIFSQNSVRFIFYTQTDKFAISP